MFKFHALPFSFKMLVPTALLAAAFAAYGTYAQSDIPLSHSFQKILANTNSSLYSYPTQLTQGIIPKAFHSHNDYWRPLPFYSALAAGGVSVEADVWSLPGDPGTLHVSRLCDLEVANSRPV